MKLLLTENSIRECDTSRQILVWANHRQEEGRMLAVQRGRQVKRKSRSGAVLR